MDVELNFLELPAWKHLFTMIMAYCDFKTILTLNCVCKRFVWLCQKERARRLRIYSSRPTKFETSTSQFYGVKCNGILVQLEYYEENDNIRIKHQQIRLDCQKYSYVAEIKNGYCDSCNTKKSQIDHEQRLLRDCYDNGSSFSNGGYLKFSQVEKLRERRAQDDRQETRRREILNNSKPSIFISK
jgi:hypothetical protein